MSKGASQKESTDLAKNSMGVFYRMSLCVLVGSLLPQYNPSQKKSLLILLFLLPLFNQAPPPPQFSQASDTMPH